MKKNIISTGFRANGGTDARCCSVCRHGYGEMTDGTMSCDLMHIPCYCGDVCNEFERGGLGFMSDK